jgi:hypothetical protein
MTREKKCLYCKGKGIADEKAAARAKRAEDSVRNASWKELEKYGAKILRGKRVLRGFDWSFSDVDIKVRDIPFLKIDCKKLKRHASHTLMREIVRKYCPNDGDLPLLVTKEHGPSPIYASVPLDFLADLLDIARVYAKDKGVTKRLTSKRFAKLVEQSNASLGEAFPVLGVPKDG